VNAVTSMFANPSVLVIVLLVPNVVGALFLYDWIRREKLTARIGELPVLGRVMATASPGRRIWKVMLQINALTCLFVALARPQVSGKRPVEIRGLDLVVAVDVSKSMLVDDVTPIQDPVTKKESRGRLALARDYADELIDALPGDRIGPVVFAGAAAHFPVTDDREVAARFLHDLGPADLPPGSNLGEVFRVSRCLLRPDLYDDLGCARIGRRGHGGDPLPGESLDPKDAPKDDVVEQKVERGKAMVVITDGGDSDEATLREVATARELGIAVFIVGVGTTQGGLVHEIDAQGNPTDTVKVDKTGATVTSKRDDAGMTALAAAGGDEHRYFVAGAGEGDPMQVVQALKAVNRGLATKKVDEKRDIFQPYLFAALILLVIEAAISTRRRRRYPEEA
jgi:Ca-activated chloride channel family protein